MSTTRYLLVQVEVGDPKSEDDVPTTRDWSAYTSLRDQIETSKAIQDERVRITAVFELTDDGLRYQRKLLIRNEEY